MIIIKHIIEKLDVSKKGFDFFTVTKKTTYVFGVKLITTKVFRFIPQNRSANEQLLSSNHRLLQKFVDSLKF